MQTICTSFQKDNHTNTSSLNVYRPDALPDAQPTVSKHWRQLSLSSNKHLLEIDRKIRDKLEKEKEDAERSERQMMEKHSQIKVL